MSQMRIFISHSSKDNSFCIPLVQSLKAAGADVFYDRDSLKGGLLYDRLTDELRTRPVFIPVLSKEAVASSFVKNECHWAFLLYENEPNRLILPVLAQALNFSEMAALLYVAGFVRVEAPNHQPYPIGQAIHEVLRILELDEGPEPPPPPAGSKDYQGFFSDLADELHKRGFSGPKSPGTQSSLTYPTGYKGVLYGVAFTWGHRVRTELYIDRPDKKRTFQDLERQRAAIEHEFGGPLEWELLEKRRASRIAIYKNASIEDSPEALNETRAWAVENLQRFKAVFSARLDT